MFERNNIDDLFLASISVWKPENKIELDNIADFFIVSICSATEYSTILKKEGEKYIDLNDTKVEITTTRNPNETNYTIDYMEPLSRYYTGDGKKKDTLSKKEAIGLSLEYYNEFHKDEEEAQKVKVYK